MVLGQIKPRPWSQVLLPPPLTSTVSEEHGPTLQGRRGAAWQPGWGVGGVSAGDNGGRGPGPAAWCGAGSHHVLSDGIWNAGLSVCEMTVLGNKVGKAVKHRPGFNPTFTLVTITMVTSRMLCCLPERGTPRITGAPVGPICSFQEPRGDFKWGAVPLCRGHPLVGVSCPLPPEAP